MELKQIVYFEAVCKQKSFSKAAEELILTQQCVSKQIQSLEQELGAKLFIRSSNGVSITEEGQYFHEQANVILQKQDEIVKHFYEIRNKRKCTLRLGVSHGLNIFFDEGFFQGFRDKYPNIELSTVDLWNTQIEENIINHSIDAGFTVAPIGHDELCMVHILKEPLYCIVNKKHRFANRESLDIDDILDEKIIIANENYNSYYNFQKICTQKRKSPVTIKTYDLMSIYDYVLHSNAVGFTLKSYSNILNFQNIKHIPLNDDDAIWDICLVYRNGVKSSLVNKFVQYVNGCDIMKKLEI